MGFFCLHFLPKIKIDMPGATFFGKELPLTSEYHTFNDYSLLNMYIKIGKQTTLCSRIEPHHYKSLFTYFRHEDD